MVRDYEIVVSINFGAPEHYQTFYTSERGIEIIVARLNAIGFRDRVYSYR